MKHVLGKFWDNVEQLNSQDILNKLKEVGASFVRPDMLKRFLREFGSPQGVPKRYFRKFVIINREDHITSLWEGQETKSNEFIEGWVIFAAYTRPYGYFVCGTPLDLRQLFIEQEGDSVAELRRGRVRQVLFLTRASELLLLS